MFKDKNKRLFTMSAHPINHIDKHHKKFPETVQNYINASKVGVDVVLSFLTQQYKQEKAFIDVLSA